MAGQDLPHDPAKALEYKEKGNKCFQAGDYHGAEELYTKAIEHDSTNPLLYTNRAMALLKLHSYAPVITDSHHALDLLIGPHTTSSQTNTIPCPNTQPPHYTFNPPAYAAGTQGTVMKAYFQLAQAQIALHKSEEGLRSAREAHRLCVEEICVGGKGGSSIGPITELVLRCKKEDWERREEGRLRLRGGLLEELVGLLGKEGKDGEGKVEELRRVFASANVKEGEGEGESRRRKVPDWCVDDITFSVMLDPVVTKTGQSYDRSSIMEHLKRSPTDPLTREPLRVEDLRPNLALRLACEEFLEENGWAVDW